MRKTSILLCLMAASALAVPASAQVAGGLTGSVGGQVGLGLPSTAPLTGQVGQTLRETRSMGRDTVRETRGTLNETRARAGASVRSDTRTSVGRDGASADLDVSAGAMVHGSDGQTLGSVVRTTRDSAGRVESLLVRAADGTVRAVPAGGARVEGDVVVTGWTRGQFERASRGNAAE